MAIAIVPHSVERKPLVEAFNAELRAAQSPWGFYVDPVPAWIPKQRDDQPVWRARRWASLNGRDQVVSEGLQASHPVLIEQGESIDIIDWLDETFPAPRLRPADPDAEAEMLALTV